MDEGEKAEKNCTVKKNNRHPQRFQQCKWPGTPSPHTNLGVKCSVFGSAPKDGNQEKRAPPRHSRKSDHAKRTRNKTPTEARGQQEHTQAGVKFFKTCFSSAVLGSVPS